MQWKGFQDDTSAALESLREDKDFADITLVCQDGQLFYAHKIVLSMSSLFFKGVLRKNKHAHPLFYMSGIKPQDLKAILDFIFFGEATILKVNLDSFYSIARELSLKGLSNDTEDMEILEIPAEMKQETDTIIEDPQYKLVSISEAKFL